MISHWNWSLSTACLQAYVEAYACHGDLGITAEEYSDRLEAILQKHLGPAPPAAEVAARLASLHKTDLYLAIACARQNPCAWERFLMLYGDYVQVVARVVSPSREVAGDLAGNLPGHLFLPGRSGACRMASYDGQATLATWLRVIITRQASNVRTANRPESLADLPDVVDELGLRRIESGLRSAKYAAMVSQAYDAAGAALSDRERLVIRWKFQDELSAQEIAGLLKVHPSTVCRLLQNTYRKLKRESAALLAARYRLGAAAVAECLEEAREGPSYSLLSAIAAE